MAMHSSLPENTVKYSLYPDLSGASGDEINKRLDSYIIDAYQALSSYIDKYIWQHEPFNLRRVLQTADHEAHIEGQVTYEDNIEDEWFIVFLLFELSKRDSGLIIKIEDFDGEFLLIEAADYLPKWLDPENSENRVFLMANELHIIPRKSQKQEESPSIKDALKDLRRNRHKSVCNEAIQRQIYSRIRSFPDSIDNEKHRVKCYIPVAIVALLEQEPQLITYAIRRFIDRDISDSPVINVMKNFPPETRVRRLITFTRCLYAQLSSQRYMPDRKIGWNLPSKDSLEFRAYDLGMKLSIGFELLVAKLRENKVHEVVDASLCTDSLWLKMHKSLTENGYFGDTIKGSELYRSKQRNAFNFYLQSIVNVECSLDRNNVENRICDLLDNIDIDVDRYKTEENSLPNEDSDDWMNIDEEKLEELLLEKSQMNEKSLHRELALKIPQAMETFVNFNKTTMKGAEFPSTRPTPPPRKKRSGGKKIPQVEVNFDGDMNELKGALNSILTLNINYSDDDESSSGGSDYEDESEREEETKESKKYMREMNSYMKAMDDELKTTKMAQSFVCTEKRVPLAVIEDDDDEDDESEIDARFNVLKNTIESFSSQKGNPGPVSNILGSMGVQLPFNSDELIKESTK